MLTRADVAYWRAECAQRCMLGSGEGRGKRAESSVPRLLPILLDPITNLQFVLDKSCKLFFIEDLAYLFMDKTV